MQINYTPPTKPEGQIYYDGYSQSTSQIADGFSHPKHYCDGGIETIDYIRAKLTKEEFLGYCKGNIMKYISRAGKKDDNSAKQDLAKAYDYLRWAKEIFE